MKPIRSMLFVPGSKMVWFDKIPSYHADAIILDLEDSVPNDLKEKAREDVAFSMKELHKQGQRVYVRINKGPYCFNMNDIEAVLQEELEGIVLPKVEGPEDIDLVTSIISEIEYKKGLPVGMTKLIPTLETARSIQFAYEIAEKKRVTAIAGVSPKSGDVERSLGYQWTEEGIERLYIRSQVVVAARAANVQPIGGLWQNVHDLAGLKQAAKGNRQLGFTGEMIIHPSHVPVINDVYSPTEKEVQYYKGMIQTFNEAVKEGKAAVLYEGEHIDYAHVKSAKAYLELAEQYRNKEEQMTKGE
ncbi:HpcH/HpaI aldolase/citrate lyase family protein [Bacillus andreraoultii]|uniref:HpcH/HpaI aldolase/citrate lyase family protein n=1 Tax=Bacillus andreraoultii TaxID=1499685 RepID=UPI000539C00C|nr:CoA ester lyase [Bacillus andreraoultii]